MPNNVEDIFMCLFAIHKSLVNYLFQSFYHLKNWVVHFLCIESWDTHVHTYICTYTDLHYIYNFDNVSLPTCKSHRTREFLENKRHVIICRSMTSHWDWSACLMDTQTFHGGKDKSTRLTHLETRLQSQILFNVKTVD